MKAFFQSGLWSWFSLMVLVAGLFLFSTFSPAWSESSAKEPTPQKPIRRSEPQEQLQRPPFLILEAQPEVKLKSGRIHQQLRVRSVPQAALDQVQAAYRFSTLLGPPSDQTSWFAAELAPDSPVLDLESGALVQVVVLIKAQSGGRHLHGQRTLRLFGRGPGESTGPGRAAEKPDWPFFTLTGPGFYPRTGENLAVAIQELAFDTAPVVWVLDGDKQTKARWTGSEYQTRLELDPNLARRGYSATKEVHFIQALADGGSASLTEAIYRSDTAGRKLAAGLGLLAISFGLGTLAGRRFKDHR
ncbi:MAG: hypothetical protein LBT47_08180 [Deltaproteobacteria bacterium]|jgi:hypothetical protein|nr:hypothetical protein [Deltaproteobacteria bacterium]